MWIQSFEMKVLQRNSRLLVLGPLPNHRPIIQPRFDSITQAVISVCCRITREHQINEARSLKYQVYVFNERGQEAQRKRKYRLGLRALEAQEQEGHIKQKNAMLHANCQRQISALEMASASKQSQIEQLELRLRGNAKLVNHAGFQALKHQAMELTGILQRECKQHEDLLAKTNQLDEENAC